jgi:signal peptidase I
VDFWNWYMGFDMVERLLYSIAIVSTICYIVARLAKLKKQHWFREYSEAFFTAVWLALIIRASLVEVYSIPSESMVPTLLVEDHLVVSKFSFGWHLPMTKGRFLELRKPERGQIVIFVPPNNTQVTFVKRCVGVPGDSIEVKDKHLYVNGKVSEYPQAYIKLQQPDPVLASLIEPDYRQFMQEHSADYNRRRRAFASRQMDRPLSEDEADSISEHDWLGPYHTEKGTYYLGLNPVLPNMLISKLQDMPAAGFAAEYPKNFKEPGIWNNLGNRDWFGPYTLKAGEYWMQGDDRDNSADSRFWGPVPEENLRGRPLIRYWPLNRFGFVD